MGETRSRESICHEESEEGRVARLAGWAAFQYRAGAGCGDPAPDRDRGFRGYAFRRTAVGYPYLGGDDKSLPGVL